MTHFDIGSSWERQRELAARSECDATPEENVEIHRAGSDLTLIRITTLKASGCFGAPSEVVRCKSAELVGTF